MIKETFTKEAAEIYDSAMEGYDFKKAAELIDSIVKASLPNANEILEIGIGTGLLAEELTKLGYSIEGVDHSSEMISKAKIRLPAIKIYELDVQNFSADHQYEAVVSHAGPLRLDYTDKRGYFMETYLADLESINSAIQRIWDSLVSGGLFIMSIQHYEGNNPSLSAPVERELGNNRKAVSQIMEEGQNRRKIRELREGDQVLIKLEHTFFTISMDTLNKIFLQHGFTEGQFDPEKKLYFTTKQ